MNTGYDAFLIKCRAATTLEHATETWEIQGRQASKATCCLSEELLHGHKYPNSNQQSSCCNNQNEKLLDSLRDCQQGLLLDMSFQFVEKIALRPSHGVANVCRAETQICQDFCQIADGRALKDLSCNDKSDVVPPICARFWILMACPTSSPVTLRLAMV